MSECEDGVGAGRVPKFSVIMPLYNKARWVRRAIESVIAQCYEDWELIVIDDGSTDGGGEIVSLIRDTRIVLIRQQNGGVAAARNVGIRVARADWVTFLDADDQWTARALAVFESLLRSNTHVLWAAAGYAKELEDGRLLAQGFAREEIAGSDVVMDDALSSLTPLRFCVGAVVVRKAVFEKVGLFDESMRIAEDPDMWFRIAIRYPLLACSKEIVAIYHWSPASLMRRGDVDVKSQERLLSRYEGELRSVSGTRRTHVCEIIRGRIHLLVRDLLSKSRSVDARAVCEKHKAFIEPRKMLIYRILIMLPGSWVRALQRVKSVWRRFGPGRADRDLRVLRVASHDDHGTVG